MDLAADPDHALITEAVDAVCAQFDDSYWSERDQRHELPWDLYRAMAKGAGRALPSRSSTAGAGAASRRRLWC